MELDLASLPLRDRLRGCADIWCASTGRSLGALSTLVTNQGSFFDRLGGERSSATTATLEKFARFFADRDSWPEGVVPDDVTNFVQVVLGAGQDCGLVHPAEVSQQ